MGNVFFLDVRVPPPNAYAKSKEMRKEDGHCMLSSCPSQGMHSVLAVGFRTAGLIRRDGSAGKREAAPLALGLKEGDSIASNALGGLLRS